MRKLATSLQIIDLVSEWTGKIASFTIFLIIGAVICFIVQRIFHSSAWFTYTTANKIFIVYVIFGAAYALRTRAYVNVDILHSHFTPRVRSIVDLATSIFFFLFCIALLWMAIETALRDTYWFHFSLKTFLPWNWPVTLLVPIGVSLFILQGLSKFARNLITAITGKEAP